jgi:hypothetical protein
MELDPKTEELRVRFTAGPYAISIASGYRIKIISEENLVNINELQSK